MKKLIAFVALVVIGFTANAQTAKPVETVKTPSTQTNPTRATEATSKAASNTASKATNNSKPAKTPEEKARMSADGLTKNLGLSKEQNDKLYKSLISTNLKIQEVRAKFGKDAAKQKDLNAAVKAINEEKNANIKSILTAEQFAKYSSPKLNGKMNGKTVTTNNTKVAKPEGKTPVNKKATQVVPNEKQK